MNGVGGRSDPRSRVGQDWEGRNDLKADRSKVQDPPDYDLQEVGLELSIFKFWRPQMVIQNTSIVSVVSSKSNLLLFQVPTSELAFILNDVSFSLVKITHRTSVDATLDVRGCEGQK